MYWFDCCWCGLNGWSLNWWFQKKKKRKRKEKEKKKKKRSYLINLKEGKDEGVGKKIAAVVILPFGSAMSFVRVIQRCRGVWPAHLFGGRWTCNLKLLQRQQLLGATTNKWKLGTFLYDFCQVSGDVVWGMVAQHGTTSFCSSSNSTSTRPQYVYLSFPLHVLFSFGAAVISYFSLLLLLSIFNERILISSRMCDTWYMNLSSLLW